MATHAVGSFGTRSASSHDDAGTPDGGRPLKRCRTRETLFVMCTHWPQESAECDFCANINIEINLARNHVSYAVVTRLFHRVITLGRESPIAAPRAAMLSVGGSPATQTSTVRLAAANFCILAIGTRHIWPGHRCAQVVVKC